MGEQRFLDEARIYVQAGDGGNGVVAFRREKYVPRGGPAGGNGGKGGDVYLQVDPQMNTLYKFHGRVHFRAERGTHGSGMNQHGRQGDDLYVPVPAGTIVRDADSGEVLGDLTEIGESLLVAQGGRGGRGNASFKTSTNQAPRISEKGEAGQERWLTLELKVIADVGLIGLPNAGKSTLLSVISAARPNIADYPFTTITPNLGVVQIGDAPPYVVADIPGLIEGAHEGKGLGDQFLRHVERCKLLVHLVDGSADDPLENFEAINSELASFNRHLASRPQLVVLTKADLPTVQQQEGALRDALEADGYAVMTISAITHEGLQPLQYRIAQMLAELPAPEPVVEVTPIYRPLDDDKQFSVGRDTDGAWRVTGVEIERIIQMINWEQEEAIERLQRQFRGLGITQALERAGVDMGDTVRVGEAEFEWL
ncbi:MAG: GTPase ObgE [Anaerolineales bacterium]|nr:GTPase ObgE [Anaerolineales bacterium]MCB9128799.1 GTPase ObgE [Ardenticatenales bacterium]MCB9171363.1 GTPase ObgE [Ardenticatenales bacterium]